MGALNLRLHPGQSAFGRIDDRDFEVTNMQGVLCLAFEQSAQIYPLPEKGMTYGFNGLTIEPGRQQESGIIRFHTTGSPILHESNYMHPADAENDIEHIYIAIQDYWLDGDYDHATKHFFLSELDDMLAGIEDQYPEEEGALDAIFDYVQEDRGIAALIEVEHLIGRLEDKSPDLAHHHAL